MINTMLNMTINIIARYHCQMPLSVPGLDRESTPQPGKSIVSIVDRSKVNQGINGGVDSGINEGMEGIRITKQIDIQVGSIVIVVVVVVVCHCSHRG